MSPEEMVVTTPASAVKLYQQKILLATPWQKQVCPLTSFCVSQLTDRRRTASLLNYGDAFVVHSRNTCADIFLQSNCDWMLMIDDDMLVPFGDAEWYRANSKFTFPDAFMGLNAIDRLLSHGKTLVGALYYGRSKNGLPVYCEAANPQENAFARKGPHNLIKPTRWVGTGCILIHRTVFEAIEKQFPQLARAANGKGGQWFTSTEASIMARLKRLNGELTDGPLDGAKAYKALTAVQEMLSAAKNENNLGSGEDVSFCLRAGASGHQPYVDLGLVCGHIGYHIYGP
jgi:hypothetical protein